VTALVLGPVLRHRAPGEATVWVETDGPATVEVLGRTAPTFTVGGRHYALVVLEGLADGHVPYDVRVDGVVAWPEPALPWPAPPMPPAAGPSRLRVAVGSCRVSFPAGGRARARYGPDALRALALRLAAAPPAGRPDLLLLVGDQVYVDHPHAARPRGFAGHADVYRRAWGDPAVRWLLAAVPSAMILDDHDVVDAWNPAAGRPAGAERERVAAALAAYWVHQHLGNLPPAELRADPLLREVRAAPDGLVPLMRAARGWAVGGGAFAYSRRVGPARLVVIDARGRRVRGGGRRAMLDAPAWRWLEREARGDAAHLVVVSSVPAYMGPGLHDLEAWGAALTDGAWGAPGRGLGRALTRTLGFEHWPAYASSRAHLDRVLADAAAGRRGAPPASVLVLAGEVHHGSLLRVHLPGLGPAPPVWHLVSSPLRNALGRRQRALLRLAESRPFRGAMRATARMAGVPAPAARTTRVAPLLFRNHVALLDLDGPRADVRIEAAEGGALRPVLRTVLRRRLA